MAKCDWEPLARRVAWKRLLYLMKGKVLKKIAKGVAGGAIMAAIDGPIPIGDIIGLFYALYKFGDACIGFWEVWDSYWFLRDDVLKRTRKMLERTAQRKGVTLDQLLDDPACCRCIERYLRKLGDVASSQNKKQFFKTIQRESRQLVRCLARC